MKKKVLGSIAVLAIAALTAFNVNINSQDNGLSDISLDNVEALASESSSKYKYVFPGSDSSVKCVCSGEGSNKCC